MIIRFSPQRKLKGYIELPTSKSYLHRALICAAVADSATKIEYHGELCEDVRATIECLSNLGADITENENNIIVKPASSIMSYAKLNCRSSASTLRFMMSAAPLLCKETEFTGSEQLKKRPVTDMVNILRSKGLYVSSPILPFTVKGRMKGGAYSVGQAVTTQNVSSLLMSLAALDGESTLITDAPHDKNLGYVPLTLSVLKKFGAEVAETAYGYKITGMKKYISPLTLYAEADWSCASFWSAANAMGSKVKCTNVNFKSKQPDRKIEDLILLIETEKNAVLDCGDCPDAVPALCAFACSVKNTVTFTAISKLVYKESNRITALAEAFSSIGGELSFTDSSLTVRGRGALSGGTTSCFNDHRIAMSLAVASAVCEKPVIVEGFEAVDKSYPDFLKDYISLGGQADVIHLR